MEDRFTLNSSERSFALEAVDVWKIFRQPHGRTVEAVRGATFQVAPGEIFGLIGPNGAGKTTLLRMLAAIIAPTRGYCRVAGFRTDEAPHDVRRHIGFLSGNTKLYGRLTVREVLRYFGQLHGMPDELISRRIEELVASFGMEEFAGRRCDSLSTGQTQRVSIARVLLHDPDVLILDEPTLGLDIMSSQTILHFIRDARARGHSVIFSTHYMTEAEVLCDRLGLIHEGSLLAVDTKAALYARTGTDNLVDAFLKIIEAPSENALA
jgi:sodium transport system ATP-binding protein